MITRVSVLLFGVLAACAESSVTPISKNEFFLSTSAAPACGQAGAARVAAKMVAVETLRAGFDGFVILGVQSANNVGAVTLPPTGAYTNSTFTGYGNTVSGSSTTTFTGGGPIFYGTHDRGLAVRMFRQGDGGYDNAVDARTFLGEDWEKVTKNGVSTCT